jgi:hypothetical protein
MYFVAGLCKLNQVVVAFADEITTIILNIFSQNPVADMKSDTFTTSGNLKLGRSDFSKNKMKINLISFLHFCNGIIDNISLAMSSNKAVRILFFSKCNGQVLSSSQCWRQ